MTAVDLNDLTFTYRDGDVPALQSVTCTVESGEFVGVVGPTDAGKSTFCRLPSGFVPEFFSGELDGTARVGDAVPVEAGVSALGTTVGHVFENPRNQLTGAATTVLEEVVFGLEQRGVEREEMKRRAQAELDRVGVAHLADRDPNALSGGQLQRVAVASVLALDPDVLVLDEPTAQLDPEGAADVFEVVSRVNDEGRTVILASHRLDHLAPAADRLFVLNNGQLTRAGPPDEVLADDAVADIVRLPEVVRLSRQLRERGVVSPHRPLPLTVSEAVDEVKQFVTGAVEGTNTCIEQGGQRSERQNTDDGRGHEVETEIRLDHVDHQYGNLEALSGVSIELDVGCVAVIGPNGAGKTTLIKHLNGLLEPDAGEVRVDGTDTRETTVADLAADVGLVFQDPDDQLFRSTVAAEVRFGPENVGIPDTDEAVKVALARVGLSDLATVDTYELGRPARKRVALASVLAMRTDVLVLDEPTGGQDYDGVRVVGDIVTEKMRNGCLVVCATHDVAFACRYADRVVALADGSVVAAGPPMDVFGDPEVREQTSLRRPAPMAVGDTLGFEGCLTVDDLLSRLLDGDA